MTIAIPAVYTIDTFGRRFLLLITFPLMGLFLLFTGFSFWIPGQEARVGCVALGIVSAPETLGSRLISLTSFSTCSG